MCKRTIIKCQSSWWALLCMANCHVLGFLGNRVRYIVRKCLYSSCSFACLYLSIRNVFQKYFLGLNSLSGRKCSCPFMFPTFCRASPCPLSSLRESSCAVVPSEESRTQNFKHANLLWQTMTMERGAIRSSTPKNTFYPFSSYENQAPNTVEHPYIWMSVYESRAQGKLELTRLILARQV